MRTQPTNAFFATAVSPARGSGGLDPEGEEDLTPRVSPARGSGGLDRSGFPCPIETLLGTEEFLQARRSPPPAPQAYDSYF